MPFAPGQVTNPAGRPKKGQTLRELLRTHPLKDKKKLVAKAYELALAGDVRWAEWIAKHSGEGAEMPELPEGSTVRRIVIEEVRYGDGDAEQAADALDTGSGDVTVSLPSGSEADLGSR